ncbi:MAG: hypothetical protein RR998_02895 [Oscillospiraceae bacterium]
MKFKKFIIPLTVIIVAAGIIVTIFIMQNSNRCDTIENRERRLREIGNLGAITTIGQEIAIDGYIISGYTAQNNRYGLAVFAPIGNGEYEFQTNANRQNDELVFILTSIHQTQYNVFWANKANLNYAQITYTVDGKTDATIKLDAKDNKILYAEAPSDDFSAEFYFVDLSGKLYE